MSLQVWLPLQGDSHNQGLIQLPTPTVDTLTYTTTNAKFGTSFSGTGRIGWHLTEDILNNQWSVAIWIKPTSTFSTTNNIIFCKNTSSSTNCQIYFSIINGTSLHLGVNGPSTSMSVNYTFSIGIWYHVAATYDGHTAALYINGEQKTTKVVTTAYSTPRLNMMLRDRSDDTTCTSYGGYAAANYAMNDFRLYDHALSEKEVQEIAKGLVVHYKLDSRFFEATTNLCSSLVQGGRTTVTNNIITNTGENADTYWYIKPKEALVGGATYTVSCYLSGFSSNTKYITWGVCAQSGTNNAGYWYCYNGFNEFTFIMPSGLNGSTANIIFDDQGGTRTEQFTISHIQLEQKDHATGFVDYGKTREADLIYDCSGYQNNATPIGALTASTDTAKYSASIAQKSGQYIRSLGRPNDFLPHDAITVNLWMKCTTWGNPISCTQGGGFNFEDISGIRFPVYISGVGYKLAESGISSSTLLNNWHMLTGTFDKATVKIYIDGELKATTTTSSTNDIGYANNYLFIGAEAAGNSTNPETSTFVGNISDVRIYATALSAAAIKDLYETSAEIDKNGNFYAREVIEL